MPGVTGDVIKSITTNMGSILKPGSLLLHLHLDGASLWTRRLSGALAAAAAHHPNGRVYIFCRGPWVLRVSNPCGHPNFSHLHLPHLRIAHALWFGSNIGLSEYHSSQMGRGAAIRAECQHPLCHV